MGNSRLIFLCLWAAVIAGCISSVQKTEKNGYIFTCPKSLKTGTSNELQLRRFGTLETGYLNVKVSYQDLQSAKETVAVEKRFEIAEGEEDLGLDLYIDSFDNNIYNGKIIINGSFGDYVIGGVDTVYFSPAKDNLVLVQTDKPLYKEGQTVKFRVLTVDKDLKPITDSETDIWVEDPSGTRLFQWKGVTLENGMQQFDFPLADEPVQGEWKIVVSFKGEITSTVFEVKEYVLPKYEVKIEIPPYVLVDAEEIPIKVCAKYTYGKPVKGDLRMNISLETYNWSHEKMPTLEYKGQINGCFEYTINVSLVDNEGRYHYRRLQIVAVVEEFATGIQRNETQYISRQFSPLNLNFNNDQRQSYKPGLPYNGKLKVSHPDNTAAEGEPIELCCIVTRERTLSTWWASKKVKFCRNYTSDENGNIDFIIPPQSTDSTGISCEALSLKYSKDESKDQNGVNQPQTSVSLTPWFSPSGSFMQLQPIHETLYCGTTQSFKVLFTSKTDADYKFKYQVISQGKVVLSKESKVSFSKENDVSGQFKDENKLLNDQEIQILPVLDSSRAPPPEEECSSAREARYVPPVGEFDIELEISPSWSPSIHFVVYYVRDDRETVADSQKLKIEKCFQNQVKLQFGDEVKQPATKTSLRLSASPNSLCGIKVVDKSVSILNADDQLTKERIFNILERFDTGMYHGASHCNEPVPQPGLYAKVANTSILPPRPRGPWSSSSYEDSLAAFESAGFLVISDLILFTRPCENRGGHEYFAYSGGGAGGVAVPLASPVRPLPPPPPPTQASADAESLTPTRGSLGGMSTKSVVDVRNFFPETWLFEMEMTDENGEYVSKEKLPHTITEWVGSAVCINKNDGLGISNQTAIKGFQAFFLSITLPYSAIRGEIITVTVSVFSYVDESLPITISLGELKGFEAVSDSIDGDICIQPGTSTNLKIQLKATSLSKQNITVKGETAQSSDVCQGSSTTNAIAKDAITNSILIEAEGWPAEFVESVLFCPKDQENGVFTQKFSLGLPEDIVPDSARSYLDVTGNVLGKSLDNLENLVQIPTGCGEQNMVKFAPNVVALDVLTEANQLTDKLKNKIVRNLNTGAQRQMQYKHPDGSFSAFGTRDKEGSMFLTAFVLRYFSAAAAYTTIDNSTLVQMQNWVTSKQQADGCFPDVGRIIDRRFQGAIEKDKSQGSITAYVLIALLDSGYQNQTVLDSALTCIKNSQDNSFYATFLYAYAEALAGKTDAAKERIASVKDKAIIKGGTQYYHDVNATRSQNIETASYAVLATLKSGGSASDSLPVVQYLAKNMNPSGGFYSTQDTCVGLEALGEFAKLTFKDPVDITVKSRGGFEKEIAITEDEKLVVKRYKIEKIPSDVEIDARGSGCAVIQNILRYNTKTPPEKRSFKIEVVGQCTDDSCKRGTISVTTSYIPENKSSGMALVEIKMISGWVPDKESLQKLLGQTDLKLMRYDVENNVVVCYFSEISNVFKQFSFEVERVVVVENSQQGTAKVYDYYNRDSSSSTSYTLEK